MFGYVLVASGISLAILVDVKGLDWRNVFEEIPLSWIFLTGVFTLLISGLYNSFYYYAMYRALRGEDVQLGVYIKGFVTIIGVIGSLATLVAFWLEYL